MGQGTGTQNATGSSPFTGGWGSQFSPLSSVNVLANWPNTPPGNSPLDAATGRLFDGSWPATTRPAFGFSPYFPYGSPGPVPTALGQFGTQSSGFGNMTGLANPLLLSMLLLMMNRPTTTMPFNPAVTGAGADTDIKMIAVPAVQMSALKIMQTGMVMAPDTVWWSICDITLQGCM